MSEGTFCSVEVHIIFYHKIIHNFTLYCSAWSALTRPARGFPSFCRRSWQSVVFNDAPVIKISNFLKKRNKSLNSVFFYIPNVTYDPFYFEN